MKKRKETPPQQVSQSIKQRRGNGSGVCKCKVKLDPDDPIDGNISGQTATFGVNFQTKPECEGPKCGIEIEYEWKLKVISGKATLSDQDKEQCKVMFPGRTRFELRVTVTVTCLKTKSDTTFTLTKLKVCKDSNEDNPAIFRVSPDF